MTPPNVTANPAEYYAWLQHWMAIPDPAVRDETPKSDKERSARKCCGDSPRSSDRVAVSLTAAQNPADGIATGRTPDTSCANNSATNAKLSPVSHVCGGSRDGGFSGRAAT